MIHNGRVNIFAANPFRTGVNNLALRDDGHIGSAATDIYDRGSAWIIYTHAGAKCRRQTFFDHHYPADACMLSSAE